MLHSQLEACNQFGGLTRAHKGTGASGAQGCAESAPWAVVVQSCASYGLHTQVSAWCGLLDCLRICNS